MQKNQVDLRTSFNFMYYIKPFIGEKQKLNFSLFIINLNNMLRLYQNNVILQNDK